MQRCEFRPTRMLLSEDFCSGKEVDQAEQAEQTQQTEPEQADARSECDAGHVSEDEPPWSSVLAPPPQVG